MTRTTATESLYGARSHESALFSIPAVDTACAEASLPGSDTSGTICVKAIAAASQSQSQTPMTMPVAAAPAPKIRSRRGGLYVMTAALAVGLISSLTAIASPPRAAPAISTAGFEVEDSASAILDGPFEDNMVILATMDDEDEEDDEMPPTVVIEPEPEPEPKPKAKQSRTKRSATKAKAKAKTKEKAKEKAKEPVVTPEPKVAGPDPMSADCLLFPAKCKIARPAAVEPAPSKPSVSLPEKLSAVDLKGGISGAKDRAEQVCADLAGSGDKVQIRLSIRGSSGAVTSATAQGAASGSDLGACVARELKKATFDRFSAPSQGLLATVRF